LHLFNEKIGIKLERVLERDNPKKGPDRPWQEGDEPMDVNEDSFEEGEPLTPRQKLHSNPLYNTAHEFQKESLLVLLKRYISDEEH
jgi:hypothetical protein